MRADNSFAFAFNKIAPPENNSPEALRAYNSNVNRAFEEIYEKVYGYVDIKNLSPQARKEINNKVESEALDKYTLLTQTEDMIALEAARVDGNMSALTVRADGIEATAVAADGKAVQAQLTANGASTTASAANGTATQALQTATEFSWKLRDPSYSHEIRMTADPDGPQLGLFRNGAYTPDAQIAAYSTELNIASSGKPINLYGQRNVRILSSGVEFDAHLLPDNLYAGQVNVGSSSARWKQAFWTTAANVSSDLRLKQDVDILDAADLLHRLTPIRYRLKSDPKKLHFGFGAQHVQEAIKGATYDDAALLADEDPDHLGLCYEELIAVLVEGHQKQQREIDQLRADMTAAMNRIATLEGAQDDRR